MEGWPWRFLDGLADRFIGFCGGLLFGQFPHFWAQYVQRLGGHLEEARLQLAQYTQAAALNHLTLEQYIRMHLESNNKVFQSTGKIIAELVNRFEMLEKAYLAFKEAPVLWRGWVFICHWKAEIVLETWRDFTPGFPVTWEGFVFALTGMICFWGGYHLIKHIIKFTFGKRKSATCNEIAL